MITSKQILTISEKLLLSKKVWGNTLNLYENPTASDILKIKEKGIEARFIANAENQKVYLWSAREGIHNDGLKVLGLCTKPTDTPYLVYGMVSLSSNGKASISTWYFWVAQKFSDTNSWMKFYKILLSMKWSWADKYIQNFSTIIRKEIDYNIKTNL